MKLEEPEEAVNWGVYLRYKDKCAHMCAHEYLYIERLIRFVLRCGVPIYCPKLPGKSRSDDFERAVFFVLAILWRRK